MIKPIVANYRLIERDINALTYFVLFFFFAIVFRSMQLAWSSDFIEFWKLWQGAIPLLSVLVAIRVANRLLMNGRILREDDRRQDIVRTTHNLIAIAKDFKARVGHVKAILTHEDDLTYALGPIAKSIEDRYETLLKPDAYKYLPGPCIDIITGMSGSVFGIVALAACRNLASTEKTSVLKHRQTNLSSIAGLDALMAEAQQLIDQLYEVRRSVNDDL